MTQDSPPQSVCPRCGKTFGCGAERGEKTCWCVALPPLAGPRPAGASCLCPDCLRQALAEQEAAAQGRAS